jgi:ABC-type branched-subunit amino acid transport system ATPase component
LRAVNGVNLEVRRGEIRSIIGPNGAGKTTLFNCITGMLDLDSGQIIFKNQNITGAPANRVAHLGMARSFQIVSLFMELTAFENVRIAALSKARERHNFFIDVNAYGDIQAMTLEVLHRVGLAGKENHIASEMTHGDQRLLEIGITLAGIPEVLLLDEPFAGLSTAEKEKVATLVRKLVPCYTIVLIDHDIDKVLALSHRIAVMHQGRVIADGSPAEIQQDEGVKQAYLGARAEAEKEKIRPAVPQVLEKAKPQLILSGVNSFYGKSHILHDISMEVGEREVVSLLGRNGAGKTTTLRSIMGVTPPPRGKITYRGEDLAGLPANTIARKGIGIVPQDRRIFPNLTVVENLRIGRKGEKGGQWNLERLFTHFPQLSDLRHSKGENLSGGEQQMLAIARTIMGNVDLLLLDEPFEGLAPRIITEIRKIIQNIASGMTVIIVEQNAEVALGLSNKTYILESGRVIFSGDSQILLENKELRARYLAV